MIDSEYHHLAERIIECATPGMRADQLIAAVREEFPNTPLNSIARAGFIAVTRSGVSHDALLSIYDMAIGVRRLQFDKTLEI